MAQKINLRGMKLVVHAAGWTEFCKALDMAMDVSLGGATIVVTSHPLDGFEARNMLDALQTAEPQRAQRTRRK